jgi:hypothetical protein
MFWAAHSLNTTLTDSLCGTGANSLPHLNTLSTSKSQLTQMSTDLGWVFYGTLFSIVFSIMPQPNSFLINGYDILLSGLDPFPSLNDLF